MSTAKVHKARVGVEGVGGGQGGKSHLAGHSSRGGEAVGGGDMKHVFSVC